MAERLYKCGYAHCQHDEEKAPLSEMTRIGKRYWHKDCAEIKDKIDIAKKYYFDYIDDKNEYKVVVGVLNNIIFKKHYSPDLVIFMMKYIVAHNCKVKSPYVLHYVIKNRMLHDEFSDDAKRMKVISRFEYRQRQEQNY